MVFSGVRCVCFGIFCVLGVLHGDLQLLGRQGAAPCQYNNVYWGQNIFACWPIIISCVISINEMVFSLMRK